MSDDIDSQISEHFQTSVEAFYMFVEKIVTLSTGALTLSVIFRNSLAGSQPMYPWILQLAWIAFMVAILMGTFCHLSKFRAHRNMAVQLLRNPTGSGWELANPGWTYHLAGKIMMWAFPIAILALTTFAVICSSLHNMRRGFSIQYLMTSRKSLVNFTSTSPRRRDHSQFPATRNLWNKYLKK